VPGKDLWRGATATRRNPLQAKVSQLRRALGDPAALNGGPAGYTLAVDPDRVDALRAIRPAEEGAALHAADDGRDHLPGRPVHRSRPVYPDLPRYSSANISKNRAESPKQTMHNARVTKWTTASGAEPPSFSSVVAMARTAGCLHRARQL
jgi:hypothetical protein